MNEYSDKTQVVLELNEKEAEALNQYLNGEKEEANDDELSWAALRIKHQMSYEEEE